MGFISRVFVKSTQVSLIREGQSFFLKFLYDNRASTYAEVIEKWPELTALDRFVEDARANIHEIRISDLRALRTVMETLRDQYDRQKKLSFYMASDVERIEIRDEAPNGFLVRYVREGNALIRLLPLGTVELEDGWLRLEDSYWRFDRLNESQIANFRCDCIEGPSIIPFLREDLETYAAAGVPVQCELSYEDEPAIALSISSFTPTRIELQPAWRVEISDIDESFQLKDYVLVRDTIRPGLLPSDLRSVLPDPERLVVLEDVRAAWFLDGFYPKWKRYISGDLSGFEAMHRWVEPPYRWLLIARAKQKRGIGRASAHPYARIGDEEFTVEQLREMLQQPYARIAAGWVRRRDLQTLGMDESGMMPDGKPLRPINLDAELLLHRGGKRLDALFSEMRMDGASWRDSGDKHSCVNDHLAFLLHWGINGGMIGGYEAMVAYGMPMLLRYCEKNRDAIVLVAGSGDDCRALSEASPIFGPLFDDKRVRLIPYDKLSPDVERTLDQRWDLACLIEPDARSVGTSVKLFQAMLSIRAACKIGFFLQGYSRDKEWLNRASMILGYHDAELTRRLIRNGRAPEALFEPFRFSPTPVFRAAEEVEFSELESASTERSRTELSSEEIEFSRSERLPVRPSRADLLEEDQGTEIDLGGTVQHGIPIPPRSADVDSSDIITISIRNPVRDFFEEARNRTDFEGKEAPHVSFLCYWPKYADMTAEQQNWYFWLRTQLRWGKYPDTDLSYLFVFIYEVLNQIGTTSPEQGLEMLMRIWKNYGERLPQLNRYLGEWVFDYTLINGLEQPAGKFLLEIPWLSDSGLNALLTEMVERKDTLRLPVWVLEKLSQYRITSSKFYQRGNQKLVDGLLPEVVEAIDRSMREKSGKGILETYAPLKMRTETKIAFVGALCESSRSYRFKYRNYIAGLKLQGFLRNLIRYTENALRAQCKFSSRLQGVELPEQVRAWVDAQLKAKLSNPKASAQQTAPAQIVLDLGSVERLRAESDQVRAALLASIGNVDVSMEEASVTNAIQRPVDAPEGMLTDLEPVQAILNRLSGEQREALEIMRSGGWHTSAQSLCERLFQTLPEVLIDEINEIALAQLGCMLIEQEADNLIVAEDYRDELEYLMPEQGPESLWSIDANGLSDDWREFFDQVRMRYSLDSLAALLDGPESFREFAKVRGEMPELLLDGLNEIASDTIGDLIADENGLFEEYLPEIQNHLIRE